MTPSPDPTTDLCPQCGTPLAEHGPLAGMCPRCVLDRSFDDLDHVRALFPELDVEEEIGRGGMGIVYRARQRKLDRPVALKVISPNLAAEATFAERFEREARALARLAHPGIVGVHDFGEREGTYYLLMEFIDGVNLRNGMKSETIGPAEALSIVPQVCAALEFAHEHGVVHRDIKPENILLTKQGLVKIADFGLAKLGGDSGVALTRTSQVLGTPHYMAPEQVSHPLEVDHRADIYSLGVVLYEMLTGELPVGAFPAPSQRVQVDVRLDEVVLRTLEREPDRRYQHASDVRTDLENLEAPRVRPVAAHDDAWSDWVERFAGGPAVAYLAALAIGATWLFGYVVYLDLPRIGYDSDAFAVAYPFAVLAFLTTRSTCPWPREGPLAFLSRGRPVLALLAAILAWGVLSFCAIAWEHNGAVVAVAALVMLGAHACLDRWVLSAEWAPAAVAGALTLLAGIIYPSGYYGEVISAVDFSSGMLALCGLTSALVRLPGVALRQFPREGQLLLLRGFGLAMLAAGIYFRREF